MKGSARLAYIALLAAACGSRTALDAPLSASVSDASSGVNDGSAQPEAGVRHDASSPHDASTPGDAAAPSDTGPGCKGGPKETAYLLDGEGTIYRYDVAARHTTVLGTPDCGESVIAWTMTTSRENAYIVYTDWTIYQVDLTTLACSPTAFQAGQLGIEDEFGVAIAEIGGVERFFVYGEPDDTSPPILATSDLSSFVLTKVGDITPAPPSDGYVVNLSADANGHLYAFAPNGLLLEIDATTGKVLQQDQTGVPTDATWAGLADGADVLLFVDGHVAGYDLVTQERTFEDPFNLDAIGGGSFVSCSN